MSAQRAVVQSMQSATLADLLERVLDKGIVIAGDIRVRLVEVELLTVQIRLVICSVDKAKEMGLDWWVNNPLFRGATQPQLGDTRPRELDTPAAAPHRSARETHEMSEGLQPVPRDHGGAT
ncbi:MAG: gas vesicle protein [Acidobacteria bacterium]|nr:gas vesicle protein [Acidobacteriota bacterium]